MSGKKCSPFSHPNFAGNWWGCCECKTMNGDHRDNCKTYNHDRCDHPEIKRIAIKEESGVRIVPIYTVKKDVVN